MKKKLTVITIIVMMLIFIGLFTVPIKIEPYGDTRIILENTYRTYIAPPCFEQSGATNNISEATLNEAKQKNYKPESKCTEQALQSRNKVLIEVVFEKLSLKESHWDW